MELSLTTRAFGEGNARRASLSGAEYAGIAKNAGAFSLNLLFDRAVEAGRFYGLRLEGVWMRVGTPDAIAAAEAAILASVA